MGKLCIFLVIASLLKRGFGDRTAMQR